MDPSQINAELFIKIISGFCDFFLLKLSKLNVVLFSISLTVSIAYFTQSPRIFRNFFNKLLTDASEALDVTIRMLQLPNEDEFPSKNTMHVKEKCKNMMDDAISSLKSVSPVFHGLFGRHIHGAHFSTANTFIFAFASLAIMLVIAALIFDNIADKKILGYFSLYFLFIVLISMVFVFCGFRYCVQAKKNIELTKLQIRSQLVLSIDFYKSLSKVKKNLKKDISDIFTTLSVKARTTDEITAIKALVESLAAFVNSGEYDSAAKIVLGLESYASQLKKVMLNAPEFRELFVQRPDVLKYLQNS